MAGRTTKDKTMGLRIEMDTVKSSEANGSPGDHLSKIMYITFHTVQFYLSNFFLCISVLKKECAVPSSVQQHQPILVDDFSYYVTNMHKEREQLFELEFDVRSSSLCKKNDYHETRNRV